MITQILCARRRGGIMSDHRMSVHWRSDSPEHYTPQGIIDAVVRLLGAIDVDPCSNSHESPSVPALTVYTAADDGLSQFWTGRVYMNPPYGRDVKQWVRKLVESYSYGFVTEAVALLPARTDTQWWQLLRDYPVCFVTGRLRFGGNRNLAPFPSAVFYLGTNVQGFYREFSDWGDVWLRFVPTVARGD